MQFFSFSRKSFAVLKEHHSMSQSLQLPAFVLVGAGIVLVVCRQNPPTRFECWLHLGWNVTFTKSSSASSLIFLILLAVSSTDTCPREASSKFMSSTRIFNEPIMPVSCFCSADCIMLGSCHKKTFCDHCICQPFYVGIKIINSSPKAAISANCQINCPGNCDVCFERAFTKLNINNDILINEEFPPRICKFSKMGFYLIQSVLESCPWKLDMDISLTKNIFINVICH